MVMALLFSKVLTSTDIGKRLAIPTRCLKQFTPEKGNYYTSVQVEDESGRIWNFGYRARKMNYPKPVFCQGWREFVISKKLCVGDGVNFYKDMKSKGLYKIELARRRQSIRLFGQELHQPPDRELVDFKITTAAAEAEAKEVEKE
ncbi:hypothetical protein REPUB_Repub13aG0100500 [Reevesia pubescens]